MINYKDIIIPINDFINIWLHQMFVLYNNNFCNLNNIWDIDNDYGLFIDYRNNVVSFTNKYIMLDKNPYDYNYIKSYNDDDFCFDQLESINNTEININTINYIKNSEIHGDCSIDIKRLENLNLNIFGINLYIPNIYLNKLDSNSKNIYNNNLFYKITNYGKKSHFYDKGYVLNLYQLINNVTDERYILKSSENKNGDFFLNARNINAKFNVFKDPIISEKIDKVLKNLKETDNIRYMGYKYVDLLNDEHNNFIKSIKENNNKYVLT